MSITGAITAVGTAATTAKKVYDIASKLQNAELNNTIGDLMLGLADAKKQLADLKEEVLRLETENKSLKTKSEGVKPTIQWGCYKFEGQQGLFCPACYDTKGKKYLTTRINSQSRRCSVCNTVLGSG